MSGHTIGVVGATGVVGKKILNVLDERVADIGAIRLFASSKSAGKTVKFRNQDILLEDLATTDFKGLDLVFFAAGSTVSKSFCQKAIDAGAIVIDNSSAFRMCKDVPLVIPELNSHSLFKHNGLIANPNCSTIQLLLAVGPIHKKNPIKRMVVTTFQSVSGTGRDAIEELAQQSKLLLNGNSPVAEVYPHPIAFNLLPEIDKYADSGMYLEEEKIIFETHKILETDIPICPTAVRVSVFFCHSEAINLQLSKPMSLEKIKQLLSDTEEVVVMDEPQKSIYPTPHYCYDKDEVFVGRIRKDKSIKNGLNMWVVADNLRRGAATNAVKIYLKLVEKNLI